MLFQYVAFLAVCAASASPNPCLHKGCPLKGGLNLRDVKRMTSSRPNILNNSNNLNILQWNILYDKVKNTSDSWLFRKDFVCDYINAVNPDIMGLQEVMESQLVELQQCLPHYHIFGEQRDSVPNALYNPILVKRSPKMRVTRTGTFWLSLIPDIKGSKAPTSKEPRICTWVEIDNGSTKPFIVATTHLAWRSQKTAANQISILIQHLQSNILQDAKQPLVVTGDFNWESNSTVYTTMKEAGFSNTMLDSQFVFPALTALPPYPGLIDYVWQQGFNSLFSATLMDNRPDNGRYLSDHRPVLAILRV
eukprot:TCONS_00005589-protein